MLSDCTLKASGENGKLELINPTIAKQRFLVEFTEKVCLHFIVFTYQVADERSNRQADY